MTSIIDDNNDDDLEWEEWDPKRISFLHHMISGSIAGLVEHISIFPIDTIKTYSQYDRNSTFNARSIWNNTNQIIRNEGFLRLWRGVSAMFAGCIPAHAAYFSIYETAKIVSGASIEGHHPIAAAFCGAIAAFSHDLIITPFDLIKQRMQLGYYNNATHCLRYVIKTEGIKALYISFPTTLMMNIPYGAIMVSVNESVRKAFDPSPRYNFKASLLAGTIAGAVAAAFTNPLDVIKTRLQTQNLDLCPGSSARLSSPLKHYVGGVSGGTSSVSSSSIRKKSTMKLAQSTAIDILLRDGNTMSLGGILGVRSSSSSVSNHNIYHRPNTKGIVEIIRCIIAEEGLRGFMKGMIPRILVQAPSVAISWTAYEGMKSLLLYE